MERGFWASLIALLKKLFGGNTPSPIPAPISSSSSSSSSSSTGGIIVTPSTRTKRALIVGIDHYGFPGNDLNGCVNDSKDVYDLLVNFYGFPPDNVRVLNDDRATKLAIEERLKWLVSETKAGDEAVWYQSSHGTQVRDRDVGGLSDEMDECVCTYDFDWDDPLTDKIIGKIIDGFVPGAFFTFICDTCHSGTMDRDMGLPGGALYKKARYLPPPFDIAARSMGRNLKVNRMSSRSIDPTNKNHLLFSGCQDNETSSEAQIGNQVRGAMTCFLTKNIRAGYYDKVWVEVHNKELQDLAANGYDQHPNLTGLQALMNRKPFGGRG
jgi:metacaspase-1